VIEWGQQTSHALWQFAVLLFAILTFTISGCTRSNDAEQPHGQSSRVTREPRSGGTYRRPLANDPASLDPAHITDTYAVAVANQIFDSLVEFDAHLNVLPALAQSWSASRDGLSWTFNLRQGILFHNGREVIAEDVVYSLSRLLDPAVGSPRSWFLDKIKGASEFQSGATKHLEGIKAIDRYTVQFVLSEPFAPFISILGLPHTSVIPREEVERLGAGFASAPVGTGGFRFVRWERGREIVLEANERYFRRRPALDRIQFVIFPGNVQHDMLQAFQRGELEESPIPLQGRRELLEAGTYNVIRKPMLSIRLLGFNLDRSPFDRREVRQAFDYAIDKVRMNQEIQGDRYVVARGILPPGMPGYNPEVQGYGYQLDKAKALLAQAGHPDGKDLAPVTLASSVKSEEVRQESRSVQQYLAAIGVQVDLKEFDDWPTFREALEHGELQMFRYGWYADYPDPDNFLYPLFHSQSPTNYFHYRNPTVDDLLDKARRETNDLRRVKLYREAEQLIVNDAPALMLLHQVYEGLFQPYIEGIEVNALGSPYIPMWKIRLKPAEPASAKR
jgi:peptide/nickel transport system substrate-binding protein/oligopeptide transport system substrate-binding protein